MAIRSNIGRVSAAALLVASCTNCPSIQAPAAALSASAVARAAAPSGVPYPIVRKQNYRIESGPLAVEVDPYDGGRILEFSLEGRSVIVPVGESPEAYASSFWPSPQSDWSWPPPPEFDKLPWKAEVDGTTLVLRSETSEKLHFSATQKIAIWSTHDALSVEFTITNHDSAPHKVAPWQNTRVRPKGITFYPSRQPTYTQSSLKLTPVDGVTWYTHDPSTVKDSLKSYADGHEGWMAQIDGDLLFVKVFPDVPRDAQAPNEGEIVIYVAGGGRFVEMEQQGPYTELAPGASLNWPVTFLVQRIPKSVRIEAGNSELVALARHLVATVKH
jgi:hypothetical protein